MCNNRKHPKANLLQILFEKLNKCDFAHKNTQDVTNCIKLSTTSTVDAYLNIVLFLLLPLFSNRVCSERSSVMKEWSCWCVGGVGIPERESCRQPSQIRSSLAAFLRESCNKCCPSCLISISLSPVFFYYFSSRFLSECVCVVCVCVSFMCAGVIHMGLRF